VSHQQPSFRNASWFAYIELVRLPNVFTAVADVVAGFLFTHPRLAPGDGWRLLVLVAASSCLYLAGMALNDLFDRAIDAQERPNRPVPSGRISPGAAGRLGWTLLIFGLGLAWGATGLGHGDLRPGLVGTVLAGCIVLYDGYLKRTPLGPLGMGACRLLNVLLGMSLIAGPWQGAHWLVAGALGLYITGVTWFARTEATESRPLHLLLALVVLLGGVAMLEWVPERTEHTIALLRQQPFRWTLLIAFLGLIIGLRCFRAVVDPTPRRVQQAVRQALLSLVVLDASVAFVVWGIPGAVAVMVLLIPAVFLGQWVHST
jgi:4-hydroxybenzoate polyprenyltransferase